MPTQKIILANEFHNDMAVVSLVFEKDTLLISRVMALPGARWSQSRKFWHITKEQSSLARALKILQLTSRFSIIFIQIVIRLVNQCSFSLLL